MWRPRSRSAVTVWPMSLRCAAQPEVFGPVASDPTVSRVFAAWLVMSRRRCRRSERSAPRHGPRCGAPPPLAGSSGERAGGQVIVDIDATLVTAHSDKEGAEPTYKRGYGFHPMCAFVDHGEHGTGETLAIDLRPGKSSAWDSADHIATLDAALAQLPEHERGQVLVRADTGAASKAFFHHITDAGVGVLHRVRGPPSRSRPRSRQSRSRRGDRGRQRRRTTRRRPGRRAHRLDACTVPSDLP